MTCPVSLHRIRSSVRQLLRDRRGNFGMITALVAVPVILGIGTSIDYTAATASRSNLQDLADSAALAGGGTYDGTNKSKALEAAENYLKAYKTVLPANTSYTVSLDGQTVVVSMKSESENAFMDIVGIKATPIGVLSNAIAPMTPKNIVFTPTKAQGWYYKKVSVIVVRPGSTAEEVVGTVTYQPLTQDDGGQGTMVKVPATAVELGKYSKLILMMEIKNDGCPLNKKAKVTNSVVTCLDSTRLADQKYDLVLRTDNPSTSHYLFVDGKQLPQGVESPLNDIIECDKVSSHAWEDGGGFARQDFFYTVTPVCAPNGQYVRLTK